MPLVNVFLAPLAAVAPASTSQTPADLLREILARPASSVREILTSEIVNDEGEKNDESQ